MYMTVFFLFVLYSALCVKAHWVGALYISCILQLLNFLTLTPFDTAVTLKKLAHTSLAKNNNWALIFTVLGTIFL